MSAVEQTPQQPVEKFWMVWGVQRSMPRYRHTSKASARKEADRLAREAPGQLFVVLAAVDARICTVSDPHVVKLIQPAHPSSQENTI